MMVKEQRSHVTAAISVIEAAKTSDKYRLTRTAYYKLSISEKKEFDRVFGDWREGAKYKRSIKLVETMSKANRIITQQQKDLLFEMACEYGVDYDKKK